MYGLELVIFQYVGVKPWVFSKKKTPDTNKYVAIAIFFVYTE